MGFATLYPLYEELHVFWITINQKRRGWDSNPRWLSP